MNGEAVPLTIATTQRAWDVVDVFDDLIGVLEAQGLAPRVQSPRNGEYSTGGIVIDEFFLASVYLGGLVSPAAVNALSGALEAFFSRKINAALGNTEPGVVGDEEEVEIIRIFGPNREVLSEVEVRPEEPVRRREVEKALQRRRVRRRR